MTDTDNLKKIMTLVNNEELLNSIKDINMENSPTTEDGRISLPPTVSAHLIKNQIKRQETER